ncbi:MAG: cob(I)yrinic acid a,c-diamide adenosyltransferase [Gemmatimonadetes bacterium]|nr:cob(I)yrinic acid a,c-diamide adenosyltransferase [Gemmatimonadota bacterium]
MGHRLSRIYTRTGDAGTTGLADGSRIDKDAPRVTAMGDVDELNSQLGVVLAQPLPDAVRECLVDVQHALFDIGGELAIPGAVTIDDACVASVENALDTFNATLPPLKEFILPGGGAAAAHAHVARSVCRRAERRLVSLSRVESVNEASRRYLNRLSDLLFVLARASNDNGRGDVLWQPGASRQS